jgi:hypothetical protein
MNNIEIMFLTGLMLSAIRLTTDGSSILHIYIQTTHRTTQLTRTIHRTTQLTRTIHRTTQVTNLEEWGP